MCVTAAVRKTFDGEMCPICRMVAAAKRQEQRQPGIPEVKIESKLLLFFQAGTPVVVVAPNLEFVRPSDLSLPGQVCFAPPVPPPRQAMA